MITFPIHNIDQGGIGHVLFYLLAIPYTLKPTEGFLLLNGKICVLLFVCF